VISFLEHTYVVESSCEVFMGGKVENWSGGFAGVPCAFPMP
jgi:hypothetical protein